MATATTTAVNGSALSNCATTATTGAVNTLYSTAANNNLTWTTTTPSYGYGTLSSSFDDYISATPKEKGLGKLIMVSLTEVELEKILDSVKEKVDKELFDNAINSIILNRHCSEDFIIKYLTFDSNKVEQLKNLLYINHEADIVSGNYAQIAVYLTLSN